MDGEDREGVEEEEWWSLMCRTKPHHLPILTPSQLHHHSPNETWQQKKNKKKRVVPSLRNKNENHSMTDIFSIVELQSLSGKNMQKFLYFFFIEIDLSTTSSNKNFLR